MLSSISVYDNMKTSIFDNIQLEKFDHFLFEFQGRSLMKIKSVFLSLRVGIKKNLAKNYSEFG